MIKQILTVFFSRIATRLLQLFSFVILARELTPIGFGIYGVLTSAVLISSQLGNMGLRQSIAVQLGQGNLDREAAAGLALACWIPLTTATAAVFYLLYGGQISEFAPLTRAAIIASIYLSLLITFTQGINLGSADFRAFSIGDSGPRILQAFFVVTLASLGALTIETSIYAFMAGFLLIVPISIYYSTKGSRLLSYPIMHLPKLIGRGALFALSLGIITLQSRVGIFSLNSNGLHTEAGHFFAAQRATEIFLEIASAVGLVLFSDAARSSDPKQKLRQSLKTGLLFVLLFLTLAISAIPFVPLVVPFVLGPSYAGSIPAAMILLLGLPPAALTRIMNATIGGLGRPWVSAAVVGLGLAINLGMSVTLIPLFGVSGAASALVASQLVCASIYILFALKWSNYTLKELLFDSRDTLVSGTKSIRSRTRKR